MEEMRVVEHDRGEGSRDGSSVENGETFLGLKRNGSDVVKSESFGGREDLLSAFTNDANLDVGVTGESSSDVGERREVSTGGNRAAKRDDGKNVVVDQSDESLENRPSNGRVSTEDI
jgi:hypothetical protein